MLVPSINITNGKCAEAIELYQRAFGAIIRHISYEKDSPEFIADGATNGSAIMHASITLLGNRVEMSDDDDPTPITGNVLNLHAYFPTDDEVCRAFDILKEGAKIEETPKPEFWSSMYARLVDRFGVKWHLMVG
ncbi:MAG: glyoxalase/bleomycin resistance/extradiol dioxygenase family protein [Defluviitaleaceae bacterium]|nr:glyoxalase/bleomycin resistance/extradiol dioxygenase family protein [Defluviitaleaceae bacterium]